MRSNYKRLGNYIREINERNFKLKDLPLLGVSIQKVMMPSIANTIGTDMSTYKLLNRGQFAYGPVTSRNGDKISVALLETHDAALISQAYTSFEVYKTNELAPEYLMMWMRRPEFDRYARFKSHGSAREIFDWNEMCNVQLPIPHIDKQREIVKEYNTIVNRIDLNNQLIQKLEETAQAIYKQWFVDFEFPNEEGLPYKSSGGEMMESELGEIPKGWGVTDLESICSKIGSGATPDGGKENYQTSGIALIRSMNVHDFVFELSDLAFIDDAQAYGLRNVIVKPNDILLNITGVSVARCCMVPAFVLPARVNQHVIIIRPYEELNLSYYLLCLLCYSDNKAKLLGISQSGSTREAITKTEVEDFDVINPSHDIALSFNKAMKSVFNLLDQKIKENNSLRNIKSLLLSKLATI